MMLLDDYMFNLVATDGLVTKEDGLGKCNNAEELAQRIAQAERGVFDDQPAEAVEASLTYGELANRD